MQRLTSAVAAAAAAALLLAPSALSQGARISGAELLTFLPGRTMEARMTIRPASPTDPSRFVPDVTPRGQPVVSHVKLVFRQDGSYVRSCVAHMPSGPQPCKFAGGRDTGVWRVEGDRLCLRGLWFQAEGRQGWCGEMFRLSPNQLEFRTTGQGPPTTTWTLN